MRVAGGISQCSAQSPQTGQKKEKLPLFQSLHAHPLHECLRQATKADL